MSDTNILTDSVITGLNFFRFYEVYTFFKSLIIHGLEQSLKPWIYKIDFSNGLSQIWHVQIYIYSPYLYI